jgi:hypothetical protein
MLESGAGRLQGLSELIDVSRKIDRTDEGAVARQSKPLIAGFFANLTHSRQLCHRYCNFTKNCRTVFVQPYG